MAAESGERRAARLRDRAERDPSGGHRQHAVADRIEQGNDGERRVARLLDVLDETGWVLLHDRWRSATSPANLDHLAVGPAGVFVIDSKNWTGGRLRLDDGGIALARYRRDDELHSAKVDADIVRRVATAVVPHAHTVGVLAFVEDVGLTEAVCHQQVVLVQGVDLPGWLGRQPAVLTPDEVQQVAAALDTALPPRSGPRPRRSALTADATGPAPHARARGSAPLRSRSAGSGRTAARPSARTAAQELALLLRKIVLAAVLGVVALVAVPVADRVLVPVVSHLLRSALVPARPPAPTTAPAAVVPGR